MSTWRELTFPNNSSKDAVLVIEDDRVNVLADFGRRLLALIEEYFPPGKGDLSGIKYGFYEIFTPIDRHPLGDSETEE